MAETEVGWQNTKDKTRRETPKKRPERSQEPQPQTRTKQGKGIRYKSKKRKPESTERSHSEPSNKIPDARKRRGFKHSRTGPSKIG